MNYICIENFCNKNIQSFRNHINHCFPFLQQQLRRRHHFKNLCVTLLHRFIKKKHRKSYQIPNFRRLRRGLLNLYIVYISIEKNRIKTSKTPNYIYRCQILGRAKSLRDRQNLGTCCEPPYYFLPQGCSDLFFWFRGCT